MVVDHHGEGGVICGREAGGEVFFDFCGIRVRAEAEAGDDAFEVGVHDDAGFVPDVGAEDMGGFPADAGESDEFFQFRGDLSVVPVLKEPGAGFDVFGFDAEEAQAVKDFFQAGEGGFGEFRGAGVEFEESGGDFVDAGIRGLGGEADGDEKPERVSVIMKHGRGFGVEFFEDIEDFSEAGSLRCSGEERGPAEVVFRVEERGRGEEGRDFPARRGGGVFLFASGLGDGARFPYFPGCAL